MGPLAIYLPAVLAEGLLYFRRALTIYRVANTVATAADTIDSLIGDKLRNHQGVLGDDAYLYLLGREIIPAINKAAHPHNYTPYDDRRIDYIVLSALINPDYQRSSPDVVSTIIAFLHALGQEWQHEDDTIYDSLIVLVNSMPKNVVVQDPVHQFLTNVDSVPGSLSSVIRNLGTKDPELASILLSIKDKVRTNIWTSAIEFAKTSKTPIYRLQTGLGYILAGASSEMPRGQDYLPVTSEQPSHSLCLSSSFLMKAINPLVIHERLPDVRSITKEMVDLASKSIMKHKGYVQEGRGDYTLLEKSKIIIDEESKGANDTFAWTSQAEAGALTQLLTHSESKLRSYSRLARIREARNLLKL